MKQFDYFRPTTLSEAISLLAIYGKDASILNGGTDLIVRMRDGFAAPKAVVDIKGINGLNEITVSDDEVFIGACVNLNKIGADKFILENYPFLAQAALSVGSKQVRNRATCIGNICNASPLADTATPLLALEAQVHIQSQQGIKKVPLKDFFVFVRKTVLNPEEIVTGISFAVNKNTLGIFTKISRRKEVDLSTVCSTVMKSEGSYKLAFGSVAPTPIRLYKTEQLLEGKPLTSDLIEKACESALDEISPISDIRASKEYRSEMVQVLLKNSLSEWL